MKIIQRRPNPPWNAVHFKCELGMLSSPAWWLLPLRNLETPHLKLNSSLSAPLSNTLLPAYLPPHTTHTHSLSLSLLRSIRSSPSYDGKPLSLLVSRTPAPLSLTERESQRRQSRVFSPALRWCSTISEEGESRLILHALSPCRIICIVSLGFLHVVFVLGWKP